MRLYASYIKQIIIKIMNLIKFKKICWGWHIVIFNKGFIIRETLGFNKLYEDVKIIIPHINIFGYTISLK